jgi:hypothetical protein
VRLALCAALALLATPPAAAGDAARALARPVSSHASLHPGGGGGGGPIPEPSTLLLVGTGLVGVALTSRLRRRARKASPTDVRPGDVARGEQSVQP